MALVRSFNVDGQTYPDAYSRILFVRVEGSQACIFLNTYADQAAREREDMPIWQEQYVAQMVSVPTTIYAQAYSFVKDLPEYTGATEVEDPADGPMAA